MEEKKNSDIVNTFAYNTAFNPMRLQQLRSICPTCFAGAQLFFYRGVVTLREKSPCIQGTTHKGRGFSTPPLLSRQPEQRENTLKRPVDPVLNIGVKNKVNVYKKPEKTAIKKLKIAVLWIQCTRNNTLVTLTDMCGNTLAWSSGGTCGFKNSRKSTTHAAETVAISMSEKIYERGYNSIHVRTTGSGRGKKKAISALSRCGLVIHKITEYGPQAFNGCRPKRKRRL